MSPPGSSLHYATSTSTLRPKTPKSVATLQEQTQWKWENLQHWAPEFQLFIRLLYILVFTLDPSQARLLEARDLRHVFDPLQPWPEERYAILLHLYRMVTTTAHEPVLRLCSDATRLELWSAFHRSVFMNASPLTTIRVGSVKAGEIQTFLNRIGHRMDLSAIRYWTGQLWHTLPLEPPWRFPFATDVTLTQEGQVTNALGTLQALLEEAGLEPAFDPGFLAPIAASRFSWSTLSLQEWSETAQASELALQATHRIFECQTNRQGLLFLVVVVVVHYCQWRSPPKVLHALEPPSLFIDFSEASFSRSLEALTTYVDLFGLHEVLAMPAFALVQGLPVDLSPERVEEWHDFWRACLARTLVDRDDGNESVGVCSGKKSDLPETGKAWVPRVVWWWPCFDGGD